MRIASVLAAASLTLGLIAAGAPAAQADLDPPADGYGECQFSDGELSSTDLAVGNTHDRSVDAYVRATDCGGFAVRDENPYLNPYLSFGPVGGYLYSDDGDPSDIFGSPSADPDSLSNSDAGKKMRGVIWLPDGSTRPFPGPTLTLKRKSEVLYQDAPSKVKKNMSFLVYAGLNVADWDLDLYVGLEKQKVQLQSKTAGGKFKTVKTVTSRTGQQGGSVEAKVKIKKETCFRWVFRGSSTNAALTSDSDCVKIKSKTHSSPDHLAGSVVLLRSSEAERRPQTMDVGSPLGEDVGAAGVEQAARQESLELVVVDLLGEAAEVVGLRDELGDGSDRVDGCRGDGGEQRVAQDTGAAFELRAALPAQGPVQLRLSCLHSVDTGSDVRSDFW